MRDMRKKHFWFIRRIQLVAHRLMIAYIYILKLFIKSYFQDRKNKGYNRLWSSIVYSMVIKPLLVNKNTKTSERYFLKRETLGNGNVNGWDFSKPVNIYFSRTMTI